jgi:hypothetical protein
LNYRPILPFFVATLLASHPLTAHAAESAPAPNPQTGVVLLLVAGLLVLGLAGAGYWAYDRYFSKGLYAHKEDPFSEQLITHTFISALPSLTRELNLEIAQSWQMEIVERSEAKRFLGLNLGTNSAQIRMPVTYRYHLRLQDSWCLKIRGKAVFVQTPEIQPSQPPAIHTDEMHIESKRGWCRVPPDGLVNQLHHDLTPTLCQYAKDPRRLAFVRETARESVAEFVRLWLARENRWNQGKFTSIHVQFQDEKTLPAAPTLQLPANTD